MCPAPALAPAPAPTPAPAPAPTPAPRFSPSAAPRFSPSAAYSLSSRPGTTADIGHRFSVMTRHCIYIIIIILI